MILADKIIEQRKKLGLSQEELAEKLSVSRQSISKWEGAQSVPDINRIIKMAEIFGVSTDYLLKDEIEEDGSKLGKPLQEEAEPSRKLRKVSLEEATNYIKATKEAAKKTCIGVMLCILSPIALMFLSAISEDPNFSLSKKLAGGIGVGILLILVAIAVVFFIQVGSLLKDYEYIEKEAIETEYGVTGMVKEEKKNFQPHYNFNIALGVALCIISPLPLIVTSCLTENEIVACSMVCVLLAFVAFAVQRFISVGMPESCYDRLLQEGDYKVEKKRESNPIMSAVAGIYWCTATAIYLIWSFSTKSWGQSWMVWPIAGVLFGGIAALVSALTEKKN